MSRYRILKPFPYGDETLEVGSTIEPEVNDGRDWRLIVRNGYAREIHDEDVSTEPSADALKAAVTDEMNRRIDEGLIAVLEPVQFENSGHLLVVRGALGELHDLELGRVLDAETGEVLFDITAPRTVPDEVAEGTEMSTGTDSGTPPASEGSAGGTSSPGTDTGTGSETPLGGTETGDSGASSERADGTDTGGEPPKPRAEVIEGEQGWFRVEAGGAKIGSSTRDRAEADRRAAEYNEGL